MRDILNNIRQVGQSVCTTSEERWQQAGADIEEVIIGNGQENISLPVFGSGVKSAELIGTPEIIERDVGQNCTIHHYEVITANDYLRHVKVIVPAKDLLEESVFTIHMDTPYLTGEEGHNERIALKLCEGTGQPVVMVGPEELPEYKSALYLVKNLGKLATDSSSISLAQSAEDSVAILDVMFEKMADQKIEMSRDVVVVGESRAAMMAGAKHRPAAKRDIRNRYYDLTDPCFPDGAFNSKMRLARSALFIPSELLHMVPVGINLASNGELCKEKKTIPTRAQYFGAAILGTAPALLNGEAGKFPGAIPLGTPVHMTSFRSNPVSYPDRWRELYGHTSYAGVNLKGAHLGLGYSSVLNHEIERINKLVYARQNAGNFKYINYRHVHLLDDQRYLDKHEHALTAA